MYLSLFVLQLWQTVSWWLNPSRWVSEYVHLNVFPQKFTFPTLQAWSGSMCSPSICWLDSQGRWLMNIPADRKEAAQGSIPDCTLPSVMKNFSVKTTMITLTARDNIQHQHYADSKIQDWQDSREFPPTSATQFHHITGLQSSGSPKEEGSFQRIEIPQ